MNVTTKAAAALYAKRRQSAPVSLQIDPDTIDGRAARELVAKIATGIRQHVALGTGGETIPSESASVTAALALLAEFLDDLDDTTGDDSASILNERIHMAFDDADPDGGMFR